jgi:hypothetical protein
MKLLKKSLFALLISTLAFSCSESVVYFDNITFGN